MLGHPEAAVAPSLGMLGQVPRVAQGLTGVTAERDGREIQDRKWDHAVGYVPWNRLAPSAMAAFRLGDGVRSKEIPETRLLPRSCSCGKRQPMGGASAVMRARIEPLRRFSVGVIATLCLLRSADGHAQVQSPESSPDTSVAAQREPIRLLYLSTPECPDAQRFAPAVLARLPGFRLAEVYEPARSFVAKLSRDSAGRTFGTLTIVERDGASAVRELSGETCEEVTSALALVAIVVNNPEALREDPPPPPPQPDSSHRSPATPPMRSAKPPLFARNAGAEHVSRSEGPWVYEVGARFELGRAVTPSWIVLPRVTAAVDPPGLPFARVLIGRASGGIDGTAGDAHVVWTQVALEACGSPERLRVALCASFALGELRAEGRRTSKGRSRGTLWAAPGLDAYVGRRLGKHVAIDGHFGAFLPLTAPRFGFGLNPAGVEVVHEVPVLGVLIGIGLSGRL
jgi:hypothetical protein